MFAQFIVVLTIFGFTVWVLWKFIGKKIIEGLFPSEGKMFDEVEKKVSKLQEKIEKAKELKAKMEDMQQEVQVTKDINKVQDEIDTLEKQLEELEKKMKKENGFTLIELMIVIAIIGILSAIAVPNYKRYIEKQAIEDTVDIVTDTIEDTKIDEIGKVTKKIINNLKEPEFICEDGKLYVLYKGEKTPLGEEDGWGDLKFKSCK